MLPRTWSRQLSSCATAALAACGRSSYGRKIGHEGAVGYNLVLRTLPILTLILLLAACTDTTAPPAPDGGIADTYQIGRGWGRRIVGIRISPDTAVVAPGHTVTFKASALLSDGGSKPIAVAWAATGGKIDSTGLFVADSTPGTYQVIGIEPRAQLADTAAVIDSPPPAVPPAPAPPPTDSTPAPAPPPTDSTPAGEPSPTVAAVSLTPSSKTLEVGGSLQLTATAKDANGVVISGLPVSWSSSKPAIASVSSSGLVKALAAGSTTVTSSIEGVDGTASITVNEPAPTVSSVSVTPALSSILVGGRVQLTATAKDSSGAVLTGLASTWTSSNPAVATISSAGVVTGVSQGTVSLTATVERVSGNAAVAVTVPVSTTGCPASGFVRLVNVTTTAELNSALLNAKPGDQIRLADGTYTNNPFWIKVSGTAAAPITLCGSRLAKVGTGSISSGNGIALAANYWTITGFTLTNSETGMVVLGGHNNIVEDLEVQGVGQAGLNLRNLSSHNILRNNYIHDTGRSAAVYGEGIYIGSASKFWCERSNCLPDRSDSNIVVGNTIGPNIGSEMVDLKEGVTGTVLQDNVFDGRGQSLNTLNLVSWVVIFGNRTTVVGNRGQYAIMHGYKVENPTGVTGWGQNTVFHDNTVDLSGAPGFGFWSGYADQGTVVGCDNAVANAGSGMANIPCMP